MIRTFHFMLSTMFLIFVLETLSSADKICNFSLQNCPENFNGKTIFVPENVVSIAPDFKVCIPLATITNKSSTPPSIMFVIDHSNSMMGGNGVDKDGSRFLVTQALLDTLNKQLPQAEVGLVVFFDRLFFDANDDSMFQRMPDDYEVPLDIKNQAYVPLLQLNKKQKNDMTGIEYLKYILKTKKIVSSVNHKDTVWSTDLVYQPSGFAHAGGTHINVAFDAAIDAMKRASYTKENQYIIFFSDGEANKSTGLTPTDQYVKGIGVPTTFTVFFTSDGGDAPQNLQKMTNNIKTNGYSATNPSSQLWAIQTNYSTLMELVMKNIFNPIIFNVKQKPTTLVINNKSFTTTIDSTTFNIGDGFKLNDSLTHFDVSVKYSIKNDSLKIDKDTSINVAFNVIRSDEQAMSDGIEIDCSDTIYYTISMQATDAVAKERDANTGTITISRNNTKGSVTVYFSKEGTATYKSDYTLSALDSVTFKDGEKSVMVTITPIEDTIIEPTENVILTLLDKFNSREIRYTINKNQSKATVTIEDSYVPPPDTLTIHITPNPFTPNNNEGFSTKVKSLFTNVINNNNSGMLIAVRSTAKLQKVPGTTDQYGTGYIYDAVGNLVTTIKMKKANNSSSDSTNYGFLWDCKNSNQRTVGIGTYLIKIRFKEASGQERVFTRKMGVKE